MEVYYRTRTMPKFTTLATVEVQLQEKLKRKNNPQNKVQTKSFSPETKNPVFLATAADASPQNVYPTYAKSPAKQSHQRQQSCRR